MLLVNRKDYFKSNVVRDWDSSRRIADAMLFFCLLMSKTKNIPGRAIKRPVCVVISASDIPAATISTVSEPPLEDIAAKVPSIPMTVPKRPKSGAEATKVFKKINLRSIFCSMLCSTSKKRFRRCFESVTFSWV